jgi:GTPase SAR1 family protein
MINLQGMEIAKWIGAVKYMECSAKLNEGVEEIFASAAEIAHTYIHERPRKRNIIKGCICL